MCLFICETISEWT